MRHGDHNNSVPCLKSDRKIFDNTSVEKDCKFAKSDAMYWDKTESNHFHGYDGNYNTNPSGTIKNKNKNKQELHSGEKTCRFKQKLATKLVSYKKTMKEENK
jgi:hypothetical protein